MDLYRELVHKAAQTSKLTQDRMRHYFLLRNAHRNRSSSKFWALVSRHSVSFVFRRRRGAGNIPETRRKWRRINNRLHTRRRDLTMGSTKHLDNRTMILVNVQLDELELSGCRCTFVLVQIIQIQFIERLKKREIKDCIFMCYWHQQLNKSYTVC